MIWNKTGPVRGGGDLDSVQLEHWNENHFYETVQPKETRQKFLNFTTSTERSRFTADQSKKKERANNKKGAGLQIAGMESGRHEDSSLRCCDGV